MLFELQFYSCKGNYCLYTLVDVVIALNVSQATCTLRALSKMSSKHQKMP